MIRLASALFVVASVYAFAVEPASSFTSGAPPGVAGDLLDGADVRTCAICHSVPSGVDPGGSVAIDAPASVAPGETIRLTVTVDNQTEAAGTRRQGFQAIVKDPASGEAVGSVTLVDPNTRFSGFGATDTVYVTHSAPGTSATSWTFDWTAPTADVPASYRVYAAGNAANGNGGTGGDWIYATTADIAAAGVSVEGVPEAAQFDVSAPAPNPVAGRLAHVEVEMDTAGDLSLAIVDGLGRLVRSVASGPRAEGRHRVEVEVDGLTAGLYFLVADGPGGRRTQPLAIAR
ncbi:MAG: choice-of-anchor V domain-containing protein [Bacteroidota bacterium]